MSGPSPLMLSVHAVDLDAVAAEVDATVADCFTPDVDEDASPEAVVDWVADVVGAGRARMRARCRASHQQPESHESHKSSAPCHGLILPRIGRARGETHRLEAGLASIRMSAHILTRASRGLARSRSPSYL